MAASGDGVTEPTYAEPTFADDELWVQNAYLRIENRRMLEVIEQIHRTTGDMLEKERRRGPVADRLVHEMQKARGAKPNAPEELDTNPERPGSGEGVGVRGLQEGRDYFTWPTVDKEKTLRDLDEWLKGQE